MPKDFFITNKKMPNSLRRFVRTEKARIRRQVLSIIEQDKQINDLYLKLAKKPKVLSQSEVPEVLSQNEVPKVLSKSEVLKVLSQSEAPKVLSKSEVPKAKTKVKK